MVRKSSLPKTPELKPRFRVLRGKDIALGPGKMELMEQLVETGSLNDAARRHQPVTRQSHHQGILIVLWVAASVSLRAADVTVFAAASLTDSLKAAAAGYEKSSGDKIIFNFGASSTLARQIEEGAPADAFFSADEAQMDRLAKQNLIDSSTRRDRLGNVLVVVVPRDSTLQITSGASLTNAAVHQIALADPKAVPAGVYAKEWLEKLRLWPAVAPKVVPTENVRGALAAAESGNVEAAVVYKTDAAISKRVKIAYAVPRAEGPDISYPVAAVKESKQPEAVKKFLNYLDSDAVAAIFERFGFIARHS